MRTLQEIYEDHSNTTGAGHGDKGTAHSYIESYEKLFSPYRDKKINFLEIGIAYGESLELWHEYFSKANIFGADIHGIEIYSNKFKPGGYRDDERFTIWISDATKPEFLDVIGDTKFDIIIDDASHQLHDQINSFNLLKDKMNPGGLYIIEDVVHLNNVEAKFKEIHDNIEIIDLRKVKGRFDDVLIVYKF